MQFVDCAMARRLEAAEAVPQLHYATVLARMRPEIGAACEDIAGGNMAFAGVGSPVGRAIGQGLTGPVSAADVDRIEAFYHSRHAPAQVDVCPLAHDSLMELLAKRRYHVTELNNVLALALSPQGAFGTAAVPGIELRPCAPEQASLWGEIVQRGFQGLMTQDCPDLNSIVIPQAFCPGTTVTLAWEGDQAVAGAACMVVPERRMVALFGAATLPAARGRGIQTALLRARLQYAVAQGCDLAVIVTRAGTTSQRNAERLGFRVAYSKVTVVLPPETTR